MDMNNYLSHYGVLGMKWGVRRYQPKKGGLTEAGKRRYLKGRKNDEKTKTSMSKRIMEVGEKVERREIAKQKKQIAKQKKRDSLTPEQIKKQRQKQLKIGAAAVAGIAGASILAYSIHKGKQKKLVKMGELQAKRYFENLDKQMKWAHEHSDRWANHPDVISVQTSVGGRVVSSIARK